MRPPMAKPTNPIICVGHREHDRDQPETRALKHIANALDPRGNERSELIVVLQALVTETRRIAVAVEKLAAATAPDKATTLGGSYSEIPRKDST